MKLCGTVVDLKGKGVVRMEVRASNELYVTQLTGIGFVLIDLVDGEYRMWYSSEQVDLLMLLTGLWTPDRSGLHLAAASSEEVTGPKGGRRQWHSLVGPDVIVWDRILIFKEKNDGEPAEFEPVDPCPFGGDDTGPCESPPY